MSLDFHNLSSGAADAPRTGGNGLVLHPASHLVSTLKAMGQYEESHFSCIAYTLKLEIDE